MTMIEKIYIKDKGYVELSYSKKTNIKSTHVDKPKRYYEIWKDCYVNGEKLNYNFFVINKTLEASEMLLYSENSTDLIKEKIRKIIDTISRNTPWNYRDTCRAIKEKLNEN